MALFAFEAIGTWWEIETLSALSADLRQRILQRIDAFDRVFSRFREDSLVSRMARAPHGGCFEFPENSIGLFLLYDRLHMATDGAVDPLVGRALEILGYDRTYSLTPAPDQTVVGSYAGQRAVWAKDIIRNGTSITTQGPVVVDVGAAGKGYLVDLVSALLHDAGLEEFVVDGSGDMRHRGKSGIRIGLEHPSDPQMAIGMVNLQGRALCASAVNRRAWGDGLHHVLDARTGIPVRDVVATWAVADDAATADGLATALFFVGQEHLTNKFDFAFVRMFADGRAEHSRNFEGELFVQGEINATHRR